MTDLDPRVAATMNVDGADNAMVLAAVLGCALGWEADARIIGNVRAGDIVRALQALAASPSPPALDGAGRIETAAKLIEDNEIMDGPDGQFLRPRSDGNRAGLAYAAAIRSLKENPMMPNLTSNQLEILKQAGGLIGRPNYDDWQRMVSDMAYLVSEGLIARRYEDEQPTAYTTSKGDALLRELAGQP